MELFGKEVIMTKKQSKTTIITGCLIVIIILAYLLILSPLLGVLKKENELKRIKVRKHEIEQQLELRKHRYGVMEKERREKKEKLEFLIEKFKKNGYKEETLLKGMVQDMLNYLDLDLLEIGKTEETDLEENLEYKKKLIPYRIKGDGRAVALLFYYLEHSRAHITWEETRIEVSTTETLNDRGDNEKEVKFKLGYYYIPSGEGEENVQE